jgi:hypothetical protein
VKADPASVSSSSGLSQVTRLTGVYDANGSLAGEIAYWVGARLGRRHCALCEVTHGLVRARREWLVEAARLPIEFTAVHLDERDPVVAEASRGREPCVVAVREDGSAEVVVDADQLEACEGDPAKLAGLLAAVR